MLSSETRDMQFWIMPAFMIHVDVLRMGGSDTRVFYFTPHFRMELLSLQNQWRWQKVNEHIV